VISCKGRGVEWALLLGDLERGLGGRCDREEKGGEDAEGLGLG
jgi:hypothetical protein